MSTVAIEGAGADRFVRWESALVYSPLDFLLSCVFPSAAIVGFWIVIEAAPGKMIFALRIVDAGTMRQATAWHYVGRYLMSFVALGIFNFGLLWVAIDPRTQGWHDKIVGTVVGPRFAAGDVGVSRRPRRATAPGSSADRWRAALGRCPC